MQTFERMTTTNLHPGSRVRVCGLGRTDTGSATTMMGLLLTADVGTIIGRDDYDAEAFVVALDRPARDDDGHEVREIVWLEDNLEAI